MPIAQSVERLTEKPGAVRHGFKSLVCREIFIPESASSTSTSVTTLKIPSAGSHTIVWTHENTARTNIAFRRQKLQNSPHKPCIHRTETAKQPTQTLYSQDRNCKTAHTNLAFTGQKLQNSPHKPCIHRTETVKQKHCINRNG